MNFLETICIQNGAAQNRESHIGRMRRTAQNFGFPPPDFPDIERLLPRELRRAKTKCRVVYREKIEEISFEEYTPKAVRSLKLVHAAPDYGFKFADRNALSTLLAQKGACDEILIVRRGRITDTSYSNVVFSKNSTLFTPDAYLLNGTKRQQLLRQGIIRQARITPENLREYDNVYLINALLDVEDGIACATSEIIA